MPAAILDGSVSTASGGSGTRLLHLQATLSAAPSGASFGTQWYDRDTGLFLREGEWAPAQPGPQSQTITAPPVDGRYRLYASVVEPDHGWSYLRGLPLLVADIDVVDGRPQLTPARITTLPALSRQKWGQRVRSAVTGPFAALTRHRGLIASMTRRDLLARYRGSTFDALWAVLSPLLLMAVYLYVFGVVLRQRFPGDETGAGYVLYFLAGLLPWLAFSEAVGRAPAAMLEHRNVVKKLVFPLEILGINLVSSALVTQLVGTVLFLVLLLVVKQTLPITALALPVVMVPQLFLMLGLVWLLAAVGVYLRDLAQLMGLLLTLLFFLTPICYADSAVPAVMRPLVDVSPIYAFVKGYRAVLLKGVLPDWRLLLAYYAATFTVMVAGYATFQKLRRGFIDVL